MRCGSPSRSSNEEESQGKLQEGWESKWEHKGIVGSSTPRISAYRSQPGPKDAMQSVP